MLGEPFRGTGRSSESQGGHYGLRHEHESEWDLFAMKVGSSKLALLMVKPKDAQVLQGNTCMYTMGCAMIVDRNLAKQWFCLLSRECEITGFSFNIRER